MVNPTARRPLFATNRAQVSSFLRRQRKKPIVQAVQRYFTTGADPGGQRITVPLVASGQSVTMDVYPTNGNSGLPSGAPAVVDNVYQTITFTLTADMTELFGNGATDYDGIIANVSTGTDFWPIDEDGTSNVVVNTGNPARNGTANANFSPADREQFTQQSGGEWLSNTELWTFGNLSEDGTGGAFSLIGGSDNVLVNGSAYRYTTTYSIASGTARYRIGSVILPPVSGDGTLTGDQAATATARMTWQVLVAPCIGGFTDNSARRLLQVP